MAGPRFSEPKYRLDQLFRRRFVDIAGDGERRVVWRVVFAEELPDVLELDRLDVGVRADDMTVVRVPLGKDLLSHRLFDDAVGPILVTLTALVPHDILLIG